MQISPRLRSASASAPLVPPKAVLLLMGTCALAAGLGVGVLWGAARIGADRSAEPIVTQRPADQLARAGRPELLPAVAQALAESDEAFHLVSPPEPAVPFDPLRAAELRAEAELPFTLVRPAPAPVAAAAPAPTAAPTTAPAPARPATQEVAGRMAKIAPASDGLPARLRARPTTQAQIVARIPIGTPLRVLGPADGARDWLRVTVNGITGYVHSDLIR